MPSVKEQAIHLIETLPISCSWDDIIYEMYVKKKIECGLMDVKRGDVISHDSIKDRFIK